MKWFSNRCTGHRKSITLLASGVLPEAERVEMEDHLAECADCRAYSAEIKLVAAPLSKWEKHFTHIELNQAQQMRWARAIKAGGESKAAHPFSIQFALQMIWRELIWPVRQIWVGLAAVWMVIFVANVKLSDAQPATMAKDKKPAADMFLALREQERVLAELVDTAEPNIAEPPKRSVPQPRSERSHNLATA